MNAIPSTLSLMCCLLLAAGTPRGASHAAVETHVSMARGGPVAPPVGAQQDARARAEAARRTLQQLQRAAQAAGADEFAGAAELMSEVTAQEQTAGEAFAGGDFPAAARAYEAAVQAIQGAVAAIGTATTAARQQAEVASRGALEAVAGTRAAIEQGRNLERRGRFNDARLAYMKAIELFERAAEAGPDGTPLVVLERYEAAMEAEDLDAYRALWLEINPNLETGISNSFDQFESWQIGYTEVEVTAESQGAATVRAVQALRFVDSTTGNPVEASTRVTFTLRRDAGRWLIEAMMQESMR